MKSKLDHLPPIVITLLICLTAYLCVRDINKRILAEVAMDKGIITIKKP